MEATIQFPSIDTIRQQIELRKLEIAALKKLQSVARATQHIRPLSSMTPPAKPQEVAHA